MGSTSEVTKKVVNIGERQNQKTIETSGYSMALFHFVDWGHDLPEILAGNPGEEYTCTFGQFETF